MLRSKVQKGKNNTTCWYDYQPFQGASSPFGPPELGRDDYISRTDFADTIRGWLGAAHEWMVKRRTHRILEKVHWSGTDYRASWLGEEFMEVSYFCTILNLSHFTASVIFSVCCETFPVCCETFPICCETFLVCCGTFRSRGERSDSSRPFDAFATRDLDLTFFRSLRRSWVRSRNPKLSWTSWRPLGPASSSLLVFFGFFWIRGSVEVELLEVLQDNIWSSDSPTWSGMVRSS